MRQRVDGGRGRSNPDVLHRLRQEDAQL
jgi:hypothetical protein